MASKFIVNVEAAIYKDNKWLMIMRSKKEAHAGGTLSMVGGTVDYSDSLEDTLENSVKREIEEEVGVKVSNNFSYIESKMFVSQKGNHVIDIVLMCEYSSGEPIAKAKDEVDEVSWMTFEDIERHPSTPPWILISMKKAEVLKSNI